MTKVNREKVAKGLDEITKDIVALRILKGEKSFFSRQYLRLKINDLQELLSSLAEVYRKDSLRDEAVAFSGLMSCVRNFHNMATRERLLLMLDRLANYRRAYKGHVAKVCNIVPRIAEIETHYNDASSFVENCLDDDYDEHALEIGQQHIDLLAKDIDELSQKEPMWRAEFSFKWGAALRYGLGAVITAVIAGLIVRYWPFLTNQAS